MFHWFIAKFTKSLFLQNIGCYSNSYLEKNNFDWNITVVPDTKIPAKSFLFNINHPTISLPLPHKKVTHFAISYQAYKTCLTCTSCSRHIVWCWVSGHKQIVLMTFSSGFQAISILQNSLLLMNTTLQISNNYPVDKFSILNVADILYVSIADCFRNIASDQIPVTNWW